MGAKGRRPVRGQRDRAWARQAWHYPPGRQIRSWQHVPPPLQAMAVVMAVLGRCLVSAGRVAAAGGAGHPQALRRRVESGAHGWVW
jgi:hypothetical protein